MELLSDGSFLLTGTGGDLVAHEILRTRSEAGEDIFKPRAKVNLSDEPIVDFVRETNEDDCNQVLLFGCVIIHLVSLLVTLQ